MAEHIPISRAALSIRTREIQREAAQLRKDYQKSLRAMLNNEKVFLLCKKLERKYPDIIRDRYGARAVKMTVDGFVYVRCAVKHFTDASPVILDFGEAGYDSYDKTSDNEYNMTRTIILRKQKYHPFPIRLELVLPVGSDCTLRVKKYITPEPFAIHEIICKGDAPNG